MMQVLLASILVTTILILGSHVVKAVRNIVALMDLADVHVRNDGVRDGGVNTRSCLPRHQVSLVIHLVQILANILAHIEHILEATIVVMVAAVNADSRSDWRHKIVAQVDGRIVLI